MKSVLISIQPKWCELIANGKKTIEVRKTRPKLETPFKCYIYCTVGGDALCPPHLNCNKWSLHKKNNGTLNGRKMTAEERTKSDYCYANGKVIGEFVCDKIEKFEIPYQAYFSQTNTQIVNNTCLTCQQIKEYANGKQSVYGWHISDLKIYDKPKELGEFELCKPKYQLIDKNDYISRYREVTHLRKAPQSWQYVESEE